MSTVAGVNGVCAVDARPAGPRDPAKAAAVRDEIVRDKMTRWVRGRLFKTLPSRWRSVGTPMPLIDLQARFFVLRCASLAVFEENTGGFALRTRGRARIHCGLFKTGQAFSNWSTSAASRAVEYCAPASPTWTLHIQNVDQYTVGVDVDAADSTRLVIKVDGAGIDETRAGGLGWGCDDNSVLSFTVPSDVTRLAVQQQWPVAPSEDCEVAVAASFAAHTTTPCVHLTKRAFDYSALVW